jgi:hypothetical protein
LPQAPQLFGSLDVSSQPDAQHSLGGEQAGPPWQETGEWQLPPTHVSPGAHALPQTPQFSGSLFVFEHPLGQQSSPGAQTGPPLQLAGLRHRLPLHSSPNAQTLPQPPQSSGSIFVSTQMAPQHDRPPVHAGIVGPQDGTHS